MQYLKRSKPFSNINLNVIFFQIYILLSTISKQNQSTLNSENRCFENINEVNIINELWNQITKILSTHLISAAEGKFRNIYRLSE